MRTDEDRDRPTGPFDERGTDGKTPAERNRTETRTIGTTAVYGRTTEPAEEAGTPADTGRNER